MDQNRLCKYCSSNQTVISPNQRYLYCLDCQKPNFYRCSCGSFNFQLKSMGSDTIKCYNCGLYSFVPEYYWVDQEALEFIRKSKMESERRKKPKKIPLNFSLINLLTLGAFLYLWFRF